MKTIMYEDGGSDPDERAPAALELPAEVTRALGRRTWEIVTGHLHDAPPGSPVAAPDAPATGARLRAEPLPEGPAGAPLNVVDEVGRLLREGNAHPDHPDFLAFTPSPGTVTGILGATLATGFAVPGGWRFTAPVSAAIESATVRWLVELLGLSPGTSGLFVSGGSTANLTALTAARDARVGTEARAATAYFSDQTHFSVPRALHVLGIDSTRVRILPGDPRRGICPTDLARRVAEDRWHGLRPFLVVANAGTTATGAVDPLPELAAFCRSEGLWLHVDGAFGAAAALTERGRARLTGLADADSLSLDPHKWLFQPAESGCVLLREPEHLTRAFGVELPSYLEAGADTSGDPHAEPDYLQWGVQQTREFRALRLWLSLKVFGARAFRAAVDRGLDAAEAVAAHVDAHPGLELVTGPSSAVVTFRPHPDRPDELVDRVCRELRAEGRAMLVGVTVAGRRTFRLCPINPRTEPARLLALVDLIAERCAAAGRDPNPAAGDR
ncbi:pyridoxal phosphate-dependent decarboxylase family protein (plasmid) [Streptomyces sp. BI20]|uniref:pyridoxal phosphate-dependent decarboxylase family protein n=1 Tax=Streptomyces sp. BI20 TaxID=3403460 RepID=UPI003C78A5F8